MIIMVIIMKVFNCGMSTNERKFNIVQYLCENNEMRNDNMKI
jgi:hypothetical protein